MKSSKIPAIPKIEEYFDPNDPEYNWVISDFWALVYEGADHDYRRAKHLFDILWSMNVRCKADFDCMRLLSILTAKGIGKVYGKIIVNMFKLRLEETVGTSNVAIPIERVMEVETA